ncbi:MAG: phosphoribosylaminoimidazolesuccinocarboxamide synthase [Bacteroidia bacterium]|nr:MAG: phosphoribosylaminoimidazolesuccinocarboxamide synthase [Bacteroidia bacterium]
MNGAIVKTDFNFKGKQNVYHGKVREVYTIDNDYLLMVVTDRISAFDVVLPKGIPYKGQVLNQIASLFLDATSDIVPNWKIDSPDPNVTFGHRCDPYPVEMIVRAYLTGSSWRTYKAGARDICGVAVPDGMKEHQRFPVPIITHTTKAVQGLHDEDISREEIIARRLVDEQEYRLLEKFSMELFIRGSEIAAKHGLILVDTKYEFGKRDGKIYLIDEIHTPDSSRYFYADVYDERFEKGLQQKQLSKEFVREWLMSNGFQGQAGVEVPFMPDEFVTEVSERYIELFEKITGMKFVKADISDVARRIERNVGEYLGARNKG